MKFSGVIPILATPFTEDEGVDLASLAKMIQFIETSGVDGITVSGLLGESNRLTDSEKESLIATAVEATEARLPVIATVSHTGTQGTIATAKMAENAGASAIMVAPIKLPAPNEQALFDYVKRVADNTDLPIVLQDHPQITAVNMSTDLILRMVAEIPSIKCLKAEALPSPQRIALLKSGFGDRDITMLTGLGALYGIYDLESGSSGFNTGFAFPEILRAIVDQFDAGNRDAAWAIYHRYLPLIVFEQQPGTAIRKEILRQRGLIASNHLRLPAKPISASAKQQLDALLKRCFGDADLTQLLEVNSAAVDF
jgi:4-hydroxy-tetrahydrodipicolinate synthase